MSNFAFKHRGLLLFILLLLIIYFPVFLHLGYMPFRIWDESILGVNALEMAHNHNYIVTYFYGYPDMYRCKPPLMLWLVILSWKMFGFSELTLRLPSALAAAALCVYLFFVLKKVTGNYLTGFFTVCILLSCQGYIGLHITRSGEYDSVWLLFSTIFSFNLFMAVEAEDKNQRARYLLLFFIFLTLGVLTKGLACMLQQFPGLFAYVLWRKKMGAFFKTGSFYAGVAIFVVFGLGYYFLRESMNPGYLKAVYLHEIRIQFAGVGRDLNLNIDGPVVKRFPFLYYIRRMIMYQFSSYIFIFPVALFVSLKLADNRIKKLINFACIAGIIFLLVISLSTKRVPHYDAPLFIYLSIITASFFYVIYTFIEKQLIERNIKPSIAPFIAFFCILALLAKPYSDIIKTVYFPKDNWEGSFSTSCLFFQHVAIGRQDINPFKLVSGQTCTYGPMTVLTCYEKELAERGYNIWFARPEELNANDKVVVFDSTDKQTVARTYQTDTLQHLEYCNADIIYIKGLKPKI